tara:strand:- start:4412 stop:5383 length:972 start_codon:yes stop_codon:yes gene_type:complete
MAGQVWSTNTLGGYLYADELSSVLRMEVRASTKFRQFCDAKDFSDKGLNNGANVTWNVYSKIDTAGTTLTEGTAIAENNFTIKQATATVVEWGNSVPFTSLTDMLGKHNVMDVTRNVLSRDCRETLDTEAESKFRQTKLKYVATGAAASTGTLYTDGTATGNNDHALNKTHVRKISDLMKERNIPAYEGDDYIAISRPTTYRELKDELEQVDQYTTTGYRKITNGEVGRFEAMRFVEQTQILAGGAAATARDGTAWTNGKSDWCYFMGADTVAEVIAMAPEIRGRIPSDYGRSMGMAWYALEGFGLVHDDATNARIVEWASAA